MRSPFQWAMFGLLKNLWPMHYADHYTRNPLSFNEAFLPDFDFSNGGCACHNCDTNRSNTYFSDRLKKTFRFDQPRVRYLEEDVHEQDDHSYSKLNEEDQSIVEVDLHEDKQDNKIKSSNLWIPCLNLTQGDKEDLVNGFMLSDKHIYAAQKLLAEQFPQIGGFQDCLLSQTKFEPVNKNSVQIHHTRGLHWVVTNWNKGDVVHVYDTLYNSVSDDLLKQMDEIYVDAPRDDSGKVINEMADVQKQDNYLDCGLFAIATVYELCKGSELSEIKFKPDGLRPHLYWCFKQGRISKFPMYEEDEV